MWNDDRALVIVSREASIYFATLNVYLWISCAEVIVGVSREKRH